VVHYQSLPSKFIGFQMLALLALFTLSFSPVVLSLDTDVALGSEPPSVVGDGEVSQSVKQLTLSERYDLASVVTLVRVLRTGNLINPASSVGGFVVIEGAAYSAELIKTWKGSAKNPMGFRVFFSSCVSPLEIQKKYLIFAQYSVEGILQAISCEDMLEGPDSEKAQLALQAFVPPA